MEQEQSITLYLRRSLKRVPGVGAVIQTRAWKILRHRLTLALVHRRNCHFTCFVRVPTQLDALAGPVLDFLLRDGRSQSLKITIIGCSTGAEPYSVASVLRERHPDLAFTIHAYDVDRECIEKATSARYTREEVFRPDLSGRTTMTAAFLDATFEKEHPDDTYVVKSDLRKHVHFDTANALNPNLQEELGTSDIVYAQHVLIHLKSRQSQRAFENIALLLNPRAVLFIAGMDLHLLQKMTRKHHLVPCDYKIEEIYGEMNAYSGGWPWSYEALEPFMSVRRDWLRRYSTIFLKDTA